MAYKRILKITDSLINELEIKVNSELKIELKINGKVVFVFENEKDALELRNEIECLVDDNFTF